MEFFFSKNIILYVENFNFLFRMASLLKLFTSNLPTRLAMDAFFIVFFNHLIVNTGL